MKRFFNLLAFSLLTLASYAYDVKVDGIYYNLNSETKEAEVTYKEYQEESYYFDSVIIPESINSDGIEYQVTSIGEAAFYKCSSLISVTIPNSVTSIGDRAFQGCSGLTSVDIPNSVTSIGDAAFDGCSGLTSVKITDLAAWCKIKFSSYLSNPLVYAHHLYLNGEEVKDLIIPNSVTSIGDYAFSGCDGLTSVTIPNSVTKIEESAFSGCDGLTSVTIPNSVTSIGNDAFGGCSGLITITIPDSVTSIGDLAFYGCSGLISVTIPKSVTSIGEMAFGECSGLSSITVDAENEYFASEDDILYDKAKELLLLCPMNKQGACSIPNSVTCIGRAAFYYCFYITSVAIPNSVTSIRDFAFDCCSGLTSITIPNSVTSIGNYAFEGCYNLPSITIPNSVKSIGQKAFYGCSGLTSVSIPNSVTSMGSAVFVDCYRMQTIYWNANINSRDAFCALECVKELIIGDDVVTVYPFDVNFSSNIEPYKIVLGKSVKYVRQDAFQNFRGDFYVYGEEPPYVYPGVFKEAILSSSTLFVPIDKVLYYQTTAPWSSFGTILPLTQEMLGVEKIELNTTAPQYYDLSGRRLNRPNTSLRIVNGKTQFVR